MKFGLVYDFRNPGQWERPFPELYARLLDQILEVERLRYDAVFITEHHLIKDGYCPAPLPVAAAIAARTSRIRIGTWVLLLPLHNAVRVAEDAGVVDQISAGRLELGLGLGYREEEFAAYGLSSRHRRGRMEEGLEIIQRALRGERFSFSGRHYTLKDVQVTPPPVQQPFPLWLAARSKIAAERAARFQAHLMLVGPPQVYHDYAAALRQAGEDPSRYQLLGFLPWFVSEDPERYWSEIRDHVAYFTALYGDWYSKKADLEEDRQWDEWTRWDKDQFRTMVLLGTADQVAESLRAAASQLPYTYLLTWANPPGLDPAKAMESIELFARRVMPRLRAG